MRVAIMQPYFLPYIGYYHLLAAVDMFIVYDNIQYTKKGWINRNRLLQNGMGVLFTLPLKSGADTLNVCERELAADFNRADLLNKFRGAYHRAPYFKQTLPVVEEMVLHEETNLFRFLHHSIVRTCQHLGLTTEIRVSSGIPIDHSLKSQSKVIALCEAVGADTYINAIGGQSLYAQEDFSHHGLGLKFIKSQPCEYLQFGNEFVPWLSLIDVMMFNPLDFIKSHLLARYGLI